MRWTFWLGRILARQLSPHQLVDLAADAWLQIRERLPREERVDFLKGAVEKYLGVFLDDLSREERAALMNSLLPLAAREFPLTDLDFLTAFPPEAGGGSSPAN
ncbi:MAG: hypothetical protein ABFD44_07375 [Anaerolineaceae bacterium]